MLRRLEIHNYAIIDHLEIDFSEGLNIITGETGAGKSILLGALGLILGKRADTKVLYQEEAKCIVEATYDISAYNLASFFEEQDLEYEDITVIRRVISPSGKSRAFINDIPTTLTVLKALNDYLIDLHQQFDTLDIHKVSFQTNTIDALAENTQRVEAYQEIYTKYRKAKRRLQELAKIKEEGEKEREFLAFQYQELADLDIQEGEYTSSESLLEMLSNAEDIKRNAAAIGRMCVDSEENIADALQELANGIRGYTQADASIEELYNRLTSVVEEIRDIGQTSSSFSEGVEHDEAKLNEVSERLDALNRLLRKHHVSDDAGLLSIQQELSDKMQAFQDVSRDIETTTTEIETLEAKLTKKASEITKARKARIPSFEKDIHDMLVPLSMEHAYIKAELIEHDSFTPSGADEVQFLFSSNKGSKFQLLKDIASGGEIARLTLCIKAMVADAITLPTLIFDEIDTGVSGEVASRMGDIFAQLASKHQVISITHSPQIAAKADEHYFVYKEDRENRTLTGIRALDMDERVLELAKMLSGNPPSEAAIANAKELLS